MNANTGEVFASVKEARRAGTPEEFILSGPRPAIEMASRAIRDANKRAANRAKNKQARQSRRHNRH